MLPTRPHWRTLGCLPHGRAAPPLMRRGQVRSGPSWARPGQALSSRQAARPSTKGGVPHARTPRGEQARNIPGNRISREPFSRVSAASKLAHHRGPAIAARRRDAATRRGATAEQESRGANYRRRAVTKSPSHLMRACMISSSIPERVRDRVAGGAQGGGRVRILVRHSSRRRGWGWPTSKP